MEKLVGSGVSVLLSKRGLYARVLYRALKHPDNRSAQKDLELLNKLIFLGIEDWCRAASRQASVPDYRRNRLYRDLRINMHYARARLEKDVRRKVKKGQPLDERSLFERRLADLGGLEEN